MNLGFETIGNATVIGYDKQPVVVTDPWLGGAAYFGSWSLPHEVPAEQMEAIKQCEYVWLSHGHPDHTHGESLNLLRDKKILIPDHYHGRMLHGLQAAGFTVHVLPDRRWQQLSPNIRVLCVADYNQDAILLLDIGGVLFINLNDASDCGWGSLVKKTAAQYKLSFLAALSAPGAADMMNFFTEDGRIILPEEPSNMQPGKNIALRTEQYGARYYVLFSSMHRYQRRDSIWANPYMASVTDYTRGFHSQTAELLAPYIQYDCHTGQLSELKPAEVPLNVVEPEAYGDNWADVLDRADMEKIRNYFQSIQHLKEVFSHITMRVGGQDTVVDLGGTAKRKALMFEVPRQSLMEAIEGQVFDDLLIGNFMKTTCVGDWGRANKSLYPDFSPYVAKYADNGGARTMEELQTYFAEYRRRDPFGFVKHRFETQAAHFMEDVVASRLRALISPDSPMYDMAKHVYRLFLYVR